MIEHMDGYFTDWGEAAVFGTATATVIVDMPTIETADALARDILLTAPETDVVGVSKGASAIVRGVTYTVRQVLSDGAGMAQIVVSKP